MITSNVLLSNSISCSKLALLLTIKLTMMHLLHKLLYQWRDISHAQKAALTAGSVYQGSHRSRYKDSFDHSQDVDRDTDVIGRNGELIHAVANEQRCHTARKRKCYKCGKPGHFAADAESMYKPQLMQVMLHDHFCIQTLSIHLLNGFVLQHLSHDLMSSSISIFVAECCTSLWLCAAIYVA